MPGCKNFRFKMAGNKPPLVGKPEIFVSFKPVHFITVLNLKKKTLIIQDQVFKVFLTVTCLWRENLFLLIFQTPMEVCMCDLSFTIILKKYFSKCCIYIGVDKIWCVGWIWLANCLYPGCRWAASKSWDQGHEEPVVLAAGSCWAHPRPFHNLH